MAEWLGTGLQNRLQQFDSARNLLRNPESLARGFVVSGGNMGGRFANMGGRFANMGGRFAIAQ